MSIKLILASTAALAMVAGTPAFAAKSNQSEQASAAAEGSARSAEAAGERKTCRYIDHTESRTKRQRLCYTKAQWKKFDKAQED
jgi:hypothetical protein